MVTVNIVNEHSDDTREMLILQKLHALQASVDALAATCQLLLQGQHMASDQAQQINTLLQKLNDNSNAEAARNAARSQVIDSISTRIDALVSQIQQGTPGLTQDEAAGAIAQLQNLNTALDALKADEDAQQARLEALGNPTAPEPVPAPTDQPPVVVPPAPEV